MNYNGVIILYWLFCIAIIVLLRKYKHFFSMFCISVFILGSCSVIFFWGIHQSHPLSIGDLIAEIEENLRSLQEFENVTTNHLIMDRFIDNCKVLSKRIWKQTCRWGNMGGFPFLSHMLWLLLPLPALPCVLPPPLRCSADHLHSFLTLKLSFWTPTPLQTLANIPLPAVPCTSSLLSFGTAGLQEAETKEESRPWSADCQRLIHNS